MTIFSINYDKQYENMIVFLKLRNIESIMNEKSPQTDKFPNEGKDLISSNDDVLAEESNFIKHKIHTQFDNETKVVFTEKSKKDCISIKQHLLS